MSSSHGVVTEDLRTVSSFSKWRTPSPVIHMCCIYMYGGTAGGGHVCEVETWWGVFRGAGRSKKDARKAAASEALRNY